jgi:N-acetylated-alpha-linked acidic dipeptidase
MSFPFSGNRAHSPPIPSYDEVISASNPLLGNNVAAGSSSGYEPPSVRLARNSEDSLYDSNLGDDELTSLETDSNDSDRDDIDDLDYQRDGLELEDMGNGSGSRRRRRRGIDSGWKDRFSDLRRRVSRWKMWQRPAWLSAALPRWQCPDVPETWKDGTSVIARLVGLFILVGLGYALFALAIFPASQNELATMFDLESVRQYAQGAVDVDRIRENLQHVTNFDHVAGTTGSFYLAEWMKDRFVKAGMDEVTIDEYEVYLNYPKKNGRRVAIIDPPSLRFEATLEENPLYPDPNLVGKVNTQVFHGHSRAGNVSGPLIYCNYGSRENYRDVCGRSAVNCTGAIALVRYYGSQGDRALKVKAAEEWGIKGVLIYSDPAEDGFVKGKVWPDGRWRPADSVQRGAVSLMSWVVGDVLTPGWASTNKAERISKDNNPGLVNIPSLPLSWRDAQPLLQSLKGHGRPVKNDWQGGVPGVEWWSGDQSSPTVLLQNDQDENDKQKIFNVMGKIEGIEPGDKTIILGNHRDSWCFGAADPYVKKFTFSSAKN